MLKKLTGSLFIDDWLNVPVYIYVENKIKFGRNFTEGLRIQTSRANKKRVTSQNSSVDKCKTTLKRDGNLDKFLQRMIISPENQELLINECNSEMT